MAGTDAFRAIRHGAELLDREPGASPTAAHVLLVLATFADGHDGRNIRPTNERVAAITGKSVRVVERAISELIELGELVRTNGPAHRGSAACYRLNLDKKARRPRRAIGGEKARRPRRESPSSTSAHLRDQGTAPRAAARYAAPDQIETALLMIAAATHDDFGKEDIDHDLLELFDVADIDALPPAVRDAHAARLQLFFPGA